MITPSILNPLHFFPMNGVTTPDSDMFDICETFSTFNSELKNGVVKDVKKYIHKVGNAETYDIVIRVTDDQLADDFEIWAYDSNHVRVPSLTIGMARVGLTNYWAGEIDTSSGSFSTNSQYVFVIRKVGDSLNVLAATDYIRILNTDNINKSVLINYGNNNVVEYAGAPADALFLIRIPASFIRPFYPEEIEEEEYANGNNQLLSSSVKEQRELKLLPVPGYIHHKMKLLLKCHLITINGGTYFQEEGYDIDWLSDDHEFAWGKVKLTLQGSTIRNIYKL